MIKVNLLPEVSRKAVRKKARPTREIPVTWILIGLVAALLTTVVLGAFHWTFTKKVASLNEEIAGVEREIQKLGIEIQKVERYKAQKEDLENKLNIINQLQVAQRGPVHLLDQLAGAVPPRLWLNEISENGAAITIVGSALDNQQVSTFMENLEKSPFFSNVELSQSTLGGQGGGPAEPRNRSTRST
ncbi:MAG: PilN domain-containing protein [Deltaproteobacteria bacterium]|nr:PilN domain-containing protein [Deltaproteobacteria bacterium]